jgi:hypothetical protein
MEQFIEESSFTPGSLQHKIFKILLHHSHASRTRATEELAALFTAEQAARSPVVEQPDDADVEVPNLTEYATHQGITPEVYKMLYKKAAVWNKEIFPHMLKGLTNGWCMGYRAGKTALPKEAAPSDKVWEEIEQLLFDLWMKEGLANAASKARATVYLWQQESNVSQPVTGSHWVKGVPAIRKEYHAKVKSKLNPDISLHGVINPVYNSPYWWASGHEFNFTILDHEIVEYLDESTPSGSQEDPYKKGYREGHDAGTTYGWNRAKNLDDEEAMELIRKAAEHVKNNPPIDPVAMLEWLVKSGYNPMMVGYYLKGGNRLSAEELYKEYTQSQQP